MDYNKCLIIAEAGVNHNGRLDLALELCDAAKRSGADVVKFQTWKTENLITRNVAQAEYQAKNTGKQETQFDMLKKFELTYDDFRKIKKMTLMCHLFYTISSNNCLISISSASANLPIVSKVGVLSIVRHSKSLTYP